MAEEIVRAKMKKDGDKYLSSRSRGIHLSYLGQNHSKWLRPPFNSIKLDVEEEAI